MRLFLANSNIKLKSSKIPLSRTQVISNGSRNLHAVSVAELIADKNSYKFTNFDNPILSPRQGKNFEFDNKFEDIEKTEFPMFSV